jgi:5-methylcytosine-specific restriction endonuclease McrA
MSTRRSMPGGYAPYRALPRGATGRCLCRWCSIEVPKGRRTFCSDDCVDQWRLRSDPGYLRDQVLKRDRGVCKSCRIDTLVAQGILKRSRGPTRQRLLNYWDLPSYTGRSLWEADHIVPVVEGGGECDLSNLRTLCLRCHRMATLGLRIRRAEARQLVRITDRAARRLRPGELAAVSTPALS